MFEAKCPVCHKSRKRAGYSKDGGAIGILLVALLFGGSNVYCSKECAKRALLAKPSTAKLEKTGGFRLLWIVTMISGILTICTMPEEGAPVDGGFIGGAIVLALAIVCWIMRKKNEPKYREKLLEKYKKEDKGDDEDDGNCDDSSDDDEA